MQTYDLLVIGGGINGASVARAATGRGLKVLLVEKDDLASHTSSASSKLIHGGLRYLEYYEFRLVREALQEREVLLRTAPHIIRPMPFVLPHAEGTRSWWMVRAGLLLYGLLAGRGTLPPAKAVKGGAWAAPLKAASRLALYWDAWVDDARLVVLNALAAKEQGAEIATRTALLSAQREGDRWVAHLSDGPDVAAGMIVNAAGPWVADVLGGNVRASSDSRVRLVKGSHIVVPALYEGEHAYILQQPDGRVVFAIPYEDAFTLIGTTDISVDAPEDAAISPEEVDYLCAAANLYFDRQIGACDVRWSYSGVRALHDDGAASAQAVTRDYHLELDDAPGAKLLSIFGGKITTARALAEEVLDTLDVKGRKTTYWSSLPGGDVGPGFLAWLSGLSEWMPDALLTRLSRAYGTRLQDVIGDAGDIKALGRHFGAGLFEAEMRYLLTYEFARTSEDILWRRTKIGLHMSQAERAGLAQWLDGQMGR